MNMQTEVFAIGPSPVQVQFHGFPGTMGSEFMHYLASDRFSSPPDHADQFAGAVPPAGASELEQARLAGDLLRLCLASSWRKESSGGC